MKSIKVCFVLHSSAKGGAERSSLEVIDGLRNKGVDCFALVPSCGPLIDELEKRAIPFRVFPYKRWMGAKGPPLWKQVGRIVFNTVFNIIAIVPIVIQAKNWKIDVIYTNTIVVCVGAFAAKILKLPHIWHIREFGYKDHRLCFDWGTKISLWLMDFLSSICLTNSEAIAQEYKRFISDQKLKVIHQAVNITDQYSFEFVKFKIQAEGAVDFRCVITGNLREGKRQEDAIKAVDELVHKEVNVRLYIIGKGNPRYEQYLRNLVVESGLEDHVTFLGYVDNIFPILQQADVALMCSRCEAFGRVTVEAMKAGVPVIGARSGGTVELIKDGFTGLLYTPGNYRELAGKIMYLYKHLDEGKRMGENGKRWAFEQFNEERLAEELLAILQELVI